MAGGIIFQSSNGTTFSVAANLITAGGTLATKANTTVTSTSYTLLEADSALVFSTGGTCTITMQNPASYSGRWLTVKNITAQALNASVASVLPLASSVATTSILTNTAGKFARLQSDGAKWVIMEAN